MKVVVRRWVPLVLWCAACGAREPEGREARVQPLAAQTRSVSSSRSGVPRLSREALLTRLKSRLSRPAGGLRVQQGADGTRRIALDGHLQHATIAVVGPDGRVRTSCVDGPAAAAHALGVEPGASTP